MEMYHYKGWIVSRYLNPERWEATPEDQTPGLLGFVSVYRSSTEEEIRYRICPGIAVHGGLDDDDEEDFDIGPDIDPEKMRR